MSLFHVIKYPISNPPTHDELAALPDNIFEPYAREVHQHADKNEGRITSKELYSLLIKHLLAYDEL